MWMLHLHHQVKLSEHTYVHGDELSSIVEVFSLSSIGPRFNSRWKCRFLLFLGTLRWMNFGNPMVPVVVQVVYP